MDNCDSGRRTTQRCTLLSKMEEQEMPEAEAGVAATLASSGAGLVTTLVRATA